MRYVGGQPTGVGQVRGRISRPGHLDRGGHLAPGVGEMARGEHFPVSPVSLLAGTRPAIVGSSFTFSSFPKEELSCPQEVPVCPWQPQPQTTALTSGWLQKLSPHQHFSSWHKPSGLTEGFASATAAGSASPHIAELAPGTPHG